MGSATSLNITQSVTFAKQQRADVGLTWRQRVDGRAPLVAREGGLALGVPTTHQSMQGEVRGPGLEPGRAHAGRQARSWTRAGPRGRWEGTVTWLACCWTKVAVSFVVKPRELVSSESPPCSTHACCCNGAGGGGPGQPHARTPLSDSALRSTAHTGGRCGRW